MLNFIFNWQSIFFLLARFDIQKFYKTAIQKSHNQVLKGDCKKKSSYNKFSREKRFSKFLQTFEFVVFLKKKKRLYLFTVLLKCQMEEEDQYFN